MFGGAAGAAGFGETLAGAVNVEGVVDEVAERARRARFGAIRLVATRRVNGLGIVAVSSRVEDMQTVI